MVIVVVVGAVGSGGTGGGVCVVLCCVVCLCVGLQVYLWMIVLWRTVKRRVWVGAAYLPIDNAGVPRCAGCVQKSLVDLKERKACLTYFHTVNENTDRGSIRDVVWSSTRQRDDLLTHQHENTTTS